LIVGMVGGFSSPLFCGPRKPLTNRYGGCDILSVYIYDFENSRLLVC